MTEQIHALGLPTDEILTHGTPRLVYGVSLVENLTEFLLGVNKKAKYYLPRQNGIETSKAISSWWLNRWVSKRITRPEILEKISRHTLVHPIQHGARVELPKTEYS